MRRCLAAAVLAVLAVACSDSPTAPTGATPASVAAPAQSAGPTASAAPVATAGGFALTLDQNGWGRALVTNTNDWPAYVEVVWERETQLAGRIVSARQGQVVPAGGVASYWPDCFWGGAYVISLPSHGAWVRHSYGPLNSPGVAVALDKYGVADVCHRSEPAY